MGMGKEVLASQSVAEDGLVAKQTEAAQRSQAHPRHADHDYAASGELIVTHRDKSGKE
jgi:hypothetical protein